MLFLAFAKSLGTHDDLVFLADGGHPVIALDRALAGDHLAGFIIGDVTLHFLAPIVPSTRNLINHLLATHPASHLVCSTNSRTFNLFPSVAQNSASLKVFVLRIEQIYSRT